MSRRDLSIPFQSLFGATGRRGPGLFDRFALYRQRRSLAALDDHLLADIGLDRSDVEHESARSTWDVPKGWRSGN